MKNSCKFWNEYDGINGQVLYCSAGAFNKKLTPDEAAACGCTTLQREKCLKAMTVNLGYGLVPIVLSDTEVKDRVLKRESAFVITS